MNGVYMLENFAYYATALLLVGHMSILRNILGTKA